MMYNVFVLSNFIYEEKCCTALGGISEDRSLHERGEIVIRTLLFQTRSHINFPLFCQREVIQYERVYISREKQEY